MGGLIIAVLAPLGIVSPAKAQAIPAWPDPLPTTLQPCADGIDSDSCTFSTTNHDTDTRYDLPTIVTYSTRVLGTGRIVGPGVTATSTVFDQTALEAPSSSTVSDLFSQAAAAAHAEALALAAGRPFVAITDSDPLLTQSSVTTNAPVFVNRTAYCSTADLVVSPVCGGDATMDSHPLTISDNSGTVQYVYDVPAGVEVAFTLAKSFGPGTILVGPDQSVTVFIPPSTTNTNANVHSEHFYAVNYQATALSLAEYEVLSTVYLQLIGTIHPDVQRTGEDFSSAFLKKLGEVVQRDHPDAGSPGRLDGGWIETYGLWSADPAQGMVPADMRASGGLRGGLTAPLGPDSVAGFAFDQGFSHIELPDVSESADLTLTQAGAYAAIEHDLVSLTFATIAGIGRARTSHGNDTLGGVSRADYGLMTAGLLAEIGYKLENDGWSLKPLIGADLAAIHTNAATEAGGIALALAAKDSARLRAWAGLTAERTFDLEADCKLDVLATARLVDVVAGGQHAVPVSMGGSPMTLEGLSDARLAVELGLSSRLHLTPQAALSVELAGAIGDGGQSAFAGRGGFVGTF